MRRRGRSSKRCCGERKSPFCACSTLPNVSAIWQHDVERLNEGGTMPTPQCRVESCETPVSKNGRMCDQCREQQGGPKHPCSDCGKPISARVKRCDTHWMEAKAGMTHRPRPRISRALREFVLTRDNFTCQNPECSYNPESLGLYKTMGLVLGHIKSHASGGETSAENLRVLCSRCNRKEWFIPGQEIPS
ncbi:MAG: HNH endonuclease [Actinobacteria bacterium]|nr:HNH endonuclease [Actinomycetota bacterium]